MRLDELEEAEVKTAVFTFGRLNPPHFGHHALIQTLQKAAQKQNCDWFLFVSSKTGDEKNPLTYEQKVWWIQALYPETKGHLVIDPSIKTPLVAATWLYKKGYHAATFVAGEDDMAGYGEMIKSGNAHGKANPDAVKAGKGFIFEPLDFAISPRLASATNARRNVTDGDPEAFVRSILGPKINPNLAKLVHDQLYPTLRKALGLSENVDESLELNKRTPTVKELAKKFMTTPDAVHRQLARGVKVEFEHTNDIEVATEIALDHLGEKLDYYTRLAKAENESVATPKKSFDENFADGKGPGRPGDSQRHGIPKKATIAQLEKASHAKGRKGQLARWQLNMRRGKKKANEEITNEVADQPYRFISPVSTATAQKSMFQTDSGTTMQVNIIVDQSSGTADVGFYDSTDKDNPTIAMTGKGDAFRIFATVGAIVKQFVAKRKPPFLSFAGKTTDPGRIKLYDMIAKNIGRYLPEYKLIDSGFANGDKGYTFQRVAQEGVVEEKKPKKPKTIIDGALKTLIAKGRSEDEAIADLKKEIDSKFYDLGENWSPMELAIMEGGHLLDEYEGNLEETLKKVKGKWALVSRHDPKKVLQYYKGSGHPSKEWVSKVERRVHSFESTMDEDYRDAARYAAQAHAGQKRSGGKPYISHPVRVANLVRKYKDSESLNKLMAAAFLHDTIEDTDTTEEQLRKMFSDLVANLVAELTSDKEKIEKLGKAEYLTQKMIHMSSWGLVIKLADRLDNVSDIKTAKSAAWRQRYKAETESILDQLEQNRKLSGTHQNIIADIRAKLAELNESWINEDEETVKPLVYLDMDGVLADFFGEWSRISGVNHYKDIDDVDAKLQMVRDHPTFWIDLPMLPHARALVKTVIEKYGEYRICSTPLAGDERSKPGKLAWIKKHLSDMPPAEIVLTHSKADHAIGNGVPNILVDDYGVNVNKWRAAGGIGIKYDDSAFDHVVKILGSIAKSGVSK